MNIYVLSSIIAFVISFFLSLLVYFKGAHDKRREAIIYVILCIGIWCLFPFFAWIGWPAQTLFFARLVYIAALFAAPTFLKFGLTILDSEKAPQEQQLIRLSFAASILIFLPFLFSSLFIKNIRKSDTYFSIEGGFLYVLFILYFGVVCLYCFYRFYLGIRESSGSIRNQLRYVFVGFLLAFSGGLVHFSAAFGFREFFPHDFLIVACMVTLTYSILKYRLMDINIALTRAGILIIVYALVLGVPLWVGFKVLGVGLWILPISIMAVFSSLAPFIYNYLRHRAEDVLLRQQKRYQEALYRLSSTMTLVKDLDRLVRQIVWRVSKVVKVNFACIYLLDPAQNKLVQKSPYTTLGFFPDMPKEIPLVSAFAQFLTEKHRPVFAEELPVDAGKEFRLKNGLIIPSFIKRKLLGFLLLGPKSSGAMYTQDDIHVFEILANQAALAIENTEFLEEFQKTQAQLFATERMASMGAMAGGMSHQINNRFHSIMLATSNTIDSQNFINSEGCPAEIKEYLGQVKYALGRIEENAKHGGKIVNDFLNFSQPDRMKKEAKQFDLREPLTSAIEMVRIKTAFPADTIVQDIPADLPQIEGDFVLLQDVFFNLLDNALDAIKNKTNQKPFPEYKGMIKVKMSAQDSHVTVTLKDNGTGISEETKKKVFVPFFTTKATASKGTGLGLFVIQKIITAHQGEVTLNSEFGEGTEFIIHLPVRQRSQT
jgi:signal transduction histidine kinase